MSIKKFEDFDINEKWVTYDSKGKKKEVEMDTKPKDKKKFSGKNVTDRKAERTKLKAKEERTEDETKKLRQLNFAIRSKTGWKKVTENENIGEDEFRSIIHKLVDHEIKELKTESEKGITLEEITKAKSWMDENGW